LEHIKQEINDTTHRAHINNFSTEVLFVPLEIERKLPFFFLLEEPLLALPFAVKGKV
jgi:hypothetical protein